MIRHGDWRIGNDLFSDTLRKFVVSPNDCHHIKFRVKPSVGLRDVRYANSVQLRYNSQEKFVVWIWS